MLTFRNVGVRQVPDLRTTVVRAGELADHLPADSTRSTPEQRTAEMWARFNAIRWRWKV